ncbi:hypothetical protein C8J57DRAFT_1506789 [Mycena rebaudengoi]|nr:hypothetical protein C8J57DRAFT_1506789 [Mycena rebaudengoi]
MTDLEKRLESYIHEQAAEKKRVQEALIADAVCRTTAMRKYPVQLLNLGTKIMSDPGADQALKLHLPWTNTWHRRTDLPYSKLRSYSVAVIAFFVYCHLYDGPGNKYPLHRFPCHAFLAHKINELVHVYEWLAFEFLRCPDLCQELWPRIDTAQNALSENVRGLQETALVSQATSSMVMGLGTTWCPMTPTAQQFAQYIPAELSQEAIVSIGLYLTGPRSFDLDILRQMRG